MKTYKSARPTTATNKKWETVPENGLSIPPGTMIVTLENGQVECPSDANFKENYVATASAPKPKVNEPVATV